jgi:hypothetical protein
MARQERSARIGASMFIHSLWAEAQGPLSVFAEELSGPLGPSVASGEQSIQWQQVFQTVADPGNADAAWQETQSGEATVRQAVSLYRVGSFVGVASADPAANFEIRDRFGSRFGISLPRLNWAASRPLSIGEWYLCAIHLRDPATDIEVISQGGVDSGPALIGQLDRYADYNVIGVSLAGEQGRLVTLYEQGQVWLQQIRPDEVPYVLGPVLVELLGGNLHA